MPTRSAEIAALYGVQPLTGSEATESALIGQAGEMRVLHVAAHGQLNTAAPSFSRLLLAPDTQNDGSLFISDIYRLDLKRTDLVILTACQTQLGRRSQRR